MNKQVTQLMNFRIPKELKNDFNSICRIKHTAMTTELLRLIKAFIKEEINEQKNYQVSKEKWTRWFTKP